jgi:hypothetical protein
VPINKSERNLNRRSLYIILALTVLMMPLDLSGQKQKPKNKSWYDDKLFHFGFSLGFNTMDFRITPSQTYLSADSLYPEVSILNPGINIQIVTNLHPANHWDIRFLPGVSFGQRNIRYYKNNVLYNGNQRLESSFLEFPLLIKYKGDRLNNVRPYVITGLNFRYDLAAKKEYPEEKPVYVRLKRPDLYYEAGAGLDFYLVYFKLSIELKMSNGLFDVLEREPASGQEQYVNAIDKMRSQMWIIAFHFE